MNMLFYVLIDSNDMHCELKLTALPEYLDSSSTIQLASRKSLKAQFSGVRKTMPSLRSLVDTIRGLKSEDKRKSLGSAV